MTLRTLVLLLLPIGSLGADTKMVATARIAHGLSYTAAEQFNKDMPFIASIDAQDPRRMLISVAPQCFSGYTGLVAMLQGSSCGYHASKNGILCAQALINRSDRDQYIASLQSTEYAHFLFGTPEASWRQHILKQRFKTVARVVHRAIIHKALKADNQLLRACINGLEPVEPVFEQGRLHYRADQDVVCRQIRQRIDRMISQGSTYSPENLQLHREQLADFFEPFVVDFTATLEGKFYDVHGTLLGVAQGDSYGRWAGSDEIMALVNHQRKTGLLQTQRRLLVADYGADLGGFIEHSYASQELSQLYALVTETNDDVVGVVLVYLGGKEPESQSVLQKISTWFASWGDSFSSHASQLQASQDHGHWIALVVSRLQGNMNYYVLDSMNNTSLLRCSRINELIAYFDGEKELPGYEWTVSEVAKLAVPTTSCYSKTKILLGGLAIGAALYGSYKLYQVHTE